MFFGMYYSNQTITYENFSESLVQILHQNLHENHAKNICMHFIRANDFSMKIMRANDFRMKIIHL
jgi:hypothetical protein